MNAFEEFLASGLERLEREGLRRTLRKLEPVEGASVLHNGRRLENFASNDYLGLASHPRLIEAAKEATARHGSGSGASRLVSGNLPEHEALEDALARFKNTPSALTFSSGYAAALGTIPALVGPGDVLWLDKLCHACLIDAARLSGATLRVFPHNDLDLLDRRLRAFREKSPSSRVLIITESVFSMDGDCAPLRQLVELKERHGAWLMVDEAHGVGVFGERGRGLADAEGVADRIEVQMGTLGKALGASGAYICGSAKLRDWLIHRARSFVYTTAPPPGPVAAATEAVRLLFETDEGPARLSRLHDNCRRLRAALPGAASPSAIFPIILGSENAAVSAARALLERGFLVPAIRYPTVARGAARLRLTLSASHSPDRIEALARCLREVAPGLC